MYSNSSKVINISMKRLLVYPAILVFFTIFSSYIFFIPGSFLYEFRENLYFLLFPIFVFFAGVSVKGFVNYYLVGRYANFICSSVFSFANGLAVFLFFTLFPGNKRFGTDYIWVFLVVVSILIYKASSLFNNGVYEESILKIFSYILSGIGVRSMFQAFWPEGYWDMGLKISVGDIILVSFTILALIQMATLLEFLRNDRLRSIAMWLKRNHLLKFLFVSSLVFALIDLRRDIVGNSIIGQWIIIFLVLLTLFIVLIVKLWGNVKNPPPEEKLRRHLQDISVDKSRDLANIARYIDEYVNSGKKSRLVSYLTFIAYKTGIPFNTICNIIAPLVEYCDPEIPGMVTREQYKAIEERNRQNRSIVIEKLTSNLEFYGRGVYGYNAYGTASNTMQNYN